MRKLFAIFIILLSGYNISLGQDKLLIAQGTAPDLYLQHVVAPKENYYSVGRMYNVSPKDLAPYNNLTFEKGFTMGQTIKIPLGPNNFSQGDAPKENEVLVPVYHIMQVKEGLYRVSVKYNKVPLDNLRKWNKLSGDAVSTGKKLIVGYLKVLNDQSPLASHVIKVNPPGITIKQEVDKKEEKIQQTDKPVVTHPAEVKPVVQDTPDKFNIPNTVNTINFNGGMFKDLYTNQVKNKGLENESGIAATFKSTSGWQDGKYYCFHNTATPGTIMKITNIANGKMVYAKVLDAIPDIKQNSGLLLRISNSAAAELGVAENKFDCTVSYAPSKSP